jgi:chromate reductase
MGAAQGVQADARQPCLDERPLEAAAHVLGGWRGQPLSFMKTKPEPLRTYPHFPWSAACRVAIGNQSRSAPTRLTHTFKTAPTEARTLQAGVSQRADRAPVSGPPARGIWSIVQIVALIGSLRKASYNRMTFDAVRELLPEGVTIEEGAIVSIPPFNDDVLEESGHPEPVRRLRQQIRTSDAVLFISPEYNYSIPGVLKNAIDWVSRPVDDQPFRGKPVAIMGAARGALGTGRMQYHLRQVFVFLEAIALTKPEVMINFEAEKFAEGRLIDEPTRQQIRRQLEALQRWVDCLRQDR